MKAGDALSLVNYAGFGFALTFGLFISTFSGNLGQATPVWIISAILLFCGVYSCESRSGHVGIGIIVAELPQTFLNGPDPQISFSVALAVLSVGYIVYPGTKQRWTKLGYAISGFALALVTFIISVWYHL